MNSHNHGNCELCDFIEELQSELVRQLEGSITVLKALDAPFQILESLNKTIKKVKTNG